jgi:hypothetical protein
MHDLDQAACDLAARGEDTVARVAAVVERARRLLEAGDIQPTSDEREQYAWEADELFPLGTPMRVFLAAVEDFATGEGLTISFFAGRARSANAFRRSIASEVGVHLANHAVIAERSNAEVPFGTMFLSDALRAKLEQIERGEDQPGTFTFFARWHANYS